MIIDGPEQDFFITIPTKTYSRSKSDTVELVFPSPSLNLSTPQKNKINDIIELPSPNLKRKSHSIEIDTPKKLKLKRKLNQKNKTIHNKTTQIFKLKKKKM